ncbi:lycopene cyclase family protein [Aquimarina pacifica]|uniref:lycopene cyclase family protein n=1 Tax=Aquimarina pacifica TaxID=1296415 RepID=UPI00047131C4|nr:lycopene cyclase family protein [Aquimarina pacifica]
MQRYDYIILGSGASGLMLAYHLAQDSFFDQKKILLLDKEVKNNNDRTWCFWEKGEGIWDEVVLKKWGSIFFGSTVFSKKMTISPYQYKMIRSKDFYDFVLDVLHKKTNIESKQESVISFTEKESGVEVQTDFQLYKAQKVFNSALRPPELESQNTYPILNQHFVGWFVKTPKPCFDSSVVTFMDFTVAQKGNTRFMYVLPISDTEALIEYTLFSEHLLEEEEYESEIQKYLEEKQIIGYEITEKEKGCIPMTCYDFGKYNSKNILHIGTAGGWTKPSTGYTFAMSSKNAKKLYTYLKNGKDLSGFKKRTRFWYYDLLFIDLLYKENRIGSLLFSKLFQKNKPQQILKFLDEETTFLEEVKITTSLPSPKFLKTLWHRLYRS